MVSELWDQQCVRLRVNVKSDNCGENAECSGKGICFSNVSMVSRKSNPWNYIFYSFFCHSLDGKCTIYVFMSCYALNYTRVSLVEWERFSFILKCYIGRWIIFYKYYCKEVWGLKFFWYYFLISWSLEIHQTLIGNKIWNQIRSKQKFHFTNFYSSISNL